MKAISLIAVTFLTAALSTSALNAERVPFNGIWEANEVSTLFGDPPIGFFSNGQGTLTTTRARAELGTLALYLTVLVDLATFDGVERARLIDSNGDSIFTYASGHADPITPEPPVFHISEIHTVTGGTGRYEHARGSFSVDRTIDLSTGDSSGTFNGAVILRGER